MVKRVSVAVVCIPLILILFFWLPPVCLPLVISALSMVGVHEVLWSTGFVQNYRISAYAIVLSGLIPIWVYCAEPTVPMIGALLAFVCLLFLEAVASRFTVTLEKMGGAFFFAVMIPYFLSAFIRISQMPLPALALLLPLVAAFTSDAFALFAGMLLGKRKLAPTISPNKTVAGAIGGLIGAIVCCILYGVVLNVWLDVSADYARLALYGMLGSVLAQFGDLSFSYIKRQYKIKDFGNVFPGHGGVLDRFDSVLLVAPLTELLLVLLPAISA